MRLLFVNGHLKVGGAEKSLLDLLRSIDYQQHQVDLLLFEGLGDYFDQLPPDVNVILCDLHPTYGSVKTALSRAWNERNLRNALLKIILTLANRIDLRLISLLKLLRITDTHYDCAIAYRVGICTEYVSYAVDAPQKYMWWHHGEFDYPKERVLRWQKVLHNITKIVCVSEATRKMIAPFFPDNAGNFAVIPNTVDAKAIVEKSKAFHPYQIETSKVLVSVGRFSPEKMMINAVYAMDILRAQGITDVKWYLVGDGAERSHVEAEIQQRNLQDLIVCTGSKDNPYPYIADSNLFVHPSYVESQGLSVLEAMVLEKPCVVTRSRGVEEFVRNKENGLLAEQSPESLAEKVIEALKMQPLQWDEMRQAQARTAAQYAPERIIVQFETLIRKA